MAAAARRALGSLGFTMVGLAALLSTFSAVNATIYGNGRLAFVLAKEGELPEVFERRVWNRPVGAVLATGLFAEFVYQRSSGRSFSIAIARGSETERAAVADAP